MTPNDLFNTFKDSLTEAGVLFSSVSSLCIGVYPPVNSNVSETHTSLKGCTSYSTPHILRAILLKGPKIIFDGEAVTGPVVGIYLSDAWAKAGFHLKATACSDPGQAVEHIRTTLKKADDWSKSHGNH